MIIYANLIRLISIIIGMNQRVSAFVNWVPIFETPFL